METITSRVSVRKDFLSVSGKTFEEGLTARIAEGVAECEAAGMTRMGISTRMGYKSDTTLSKWVTGHQSPKPENLAQLADATGLSLDWLLLERGPKFAPDGSEAIRLQIIGKIVEGRMGEALIELLPTLQPSLPEDVAQGLASSILQVQQGETGEGGDANEEGHG